ncbi:Cell morphogenesis protein PAG1 [Coemansia sp. Benny D115]|nr:Cell morphogenesis protein PAG1 [Coemansia sp. Benny D115]
MANSDKNLDPRRPKNPFGNYSFMEAQQQSARPLQPLVPSRSESTSTVPSPAGGGHLNQPPLLKTSGSNPFGNYNFQEAQQQYGTPLSAPGPPSPTGSALGSYSVHYPFTAPVPVSASASALAPAPGSASAVPGHSTASSALNADGATGLSRADTGKSMQYWQQPPDMAEPSLHTYASSKNPAYTHIQMPLSEHGAPVTAASDSRYDNHTQRAQSPLQRYQQQLQMQQMQQMQLQIQQQQQHQQQHQQINANASGSIEQYAIRVLYEEFRDRAASKIDTIVDLRLDREPDLAKYLDLGADPVFDRTLEKLGMMARRRPRVIIELLLVWRKATIELADEASLDSAGPAHASSNQAHQPSSVLSRAHYIMKERRSLVSVYILCRALSAVVEQLEASHLEGDLGDRLEELVFGQVKQANPANLRRSQSRREIQDMYARLIGRISGIRFASMSDRFIAELERIPMVSGGNDERIVLLLHNMRFLRLRVFPIDALEESSAFLLSCAKFYSRTSGSLRLKHAWATLLTELLMPMAAVVDVEVNLPELVQAIDIIYTKAMKMAAKVRHVNVAFPLAAATLCISRQDLFHQRWLSLLEYCIQRLKDKQFRRVSMDAILRMFWVYLFRYPESNAVVLRRIDSLSRIFFPATKLHAWPKTVPHSAFVYFLTCAACYNFDFAMRQLLHNMLQIDSGWPGTTKDIIDPGPFLDSLNPARVGIAFQALVSVAAIASKKAASSAAAAAASASASANAAAGKHGAGATVVKENSDEAGNLMGKAGLSSTGSPALSFHPPFPGVAQLSGLDFFEVGSQSSAQTESSDGSKCGANGAATVGGRAGGHAAASSLSAKGAVPTGLGAAAYGFNSFPDAINASQPPFIVVEHLPDNIKSALATAIGVVTRYFNALYPIFGNYVLADKQLWRVSRKMPPMSSVVLTGSTFNFENTAPLVSSSSSNRDQQAPPTSISNSATAGAGGSSSAAAAAAASRALTMKEDAIGGTGGSGISGSGGSGPGGLDHSDNPDRDEAHSGDAAVNILRQEAERYTPERQVYLDLMSVYTRNVPRSQLFWSQTDLAKLIDTLVQNIVHVDQALAAESRACLMDLLCPPSIRQPFDMRAASELFATRSDRLAAICQAVTKATQVLRATDDRFTEILVGGIFTRDARSSVPIAQPGDPLTDAPGIFPLGAMQGSGGRRFMHTANFSTTSNASNGNGNGNASGGNAAAVPGLAADSSSRSITGTISDQEIQPEEPTPGIFRHSHSLSEQPADDIEFDLDGPTSAAAAAAAFGQTAQMRKDSAAPMVGELNGGFLHVFLDLMHYMEVALAECLAEKDSAGGVSATETLGSPAANVSPASNAGLNASAAASSEPSDIDDATSAGDVRKVGGRSVAGWSSLLSAVEANFIALLCSSSVRVRHSTVNVLYQVGVLRRIIASHEPLPPAGHSWLFRNVESTYEVLNMLVPRKNTQQQQHHQQNVVRGLAGLMAESTLNAPPISEHWDVPFGPDDSASLGQRLVQRPLAKLATSSRETDIALWLSHFPLFVRRACVLIPDVMLVARTLVCQRLYQMQPLMNQYADISAKSGAYGISMYLRGYGQRTHDKAGALTVRADLVSAYGNLFLFAVVSLPTSDSMALRSGSGGAGGFLGDTGIAGTRSPKGGLPSSVFGGSSGSAGNSTGGSNGGSSGSGGGGGRSRFAKSIARKLAPLKSHSRGSKQEQGVGLASITQLVRMASSILRSDNAPLRQQTAYALCNTHPMYLQELMQELRPLAESLFDDGSSLSSHRNYLHVSGAASSALSNAGLMASLAHGSSSPNTLAQQLRGSGGGGASGGSNSTGAGGSPRTAAQHAYRAGSSILAAAQLAPYGSSKRKALRAGNSSLAREGSELGSDTEVTSDSGNMRQKSGPNRAKSNGGRAAGHNQERRANSFDATTANTSSKSTHFSGLLAHHGHAESTGSAGSASGAINQGNVAALAAAAAAAAAVSAGGASSGSVNLMRRRRLRLSLVQIYKQVSRQLDALDHEGSALYMDEQLMAHLVSYIRETKAFLSESTVQWEWEHQSLRIHFCGLVEAVYYFISTIEAPLVWSEGQLHAAAADPKDGSASNSTTLPSVGVLGSSKISQKFTHETRNGLYQLFERWCSLGRHAENSRETQIRMMSSALEQVKDHNERRFTVSLMESERQELELTSLRAMAVLCRDGLLATSQQSALRMNSSSAGASVAACSGADSKVAESGGPRDKAILFSWTTDALDHANPRFQLIAQRAVEWTIRSNPMDKSMVRALVQLAYGISVPGSISSMLFQKSPGRDAVSGGSSSGGAVPNASSAAAANQAGGASGLGLVFGAGDSSGLGTSIRHGSGATAAAAAAAMSSGGDMSVLTNDRVVLGYLRAIAAIVSPETAIVGATVAATSGGFRDTGVLCGGDTNYVAAGKALATRYHDWLLPLILFQLRSDQHRIRKQALLILRTLCIHMSADIACVYLLDEMGPSIVCDIPAIASGAAIKLFAAVARAFTGHSVSLVIEIVRQVYAQGLFGSRFDVLMAIVKPWLSNIVLRHQEAGRGAPASQELYALQEDSDDNDRYSENDVASLEPVALCRDSLLVLQCMLYLTACTSNDSVSTMQDLWLSLASNGDADDSAAGLAKEGEPHNMWLIMRYLSGLLIHSRSMALLGFMRRVSVFLTRSPRGTQLLRMLVEETMQPSAAIPLAASDIPARNIANGQLSNEAWVAEIAHFTRQPSPSLSQNQRGDGARGAESKLLVSTAGLAMFYLGAISYEQPHAMAEYRSLAVLPSTIVLLADSQRWVRDAARTVLVNLVASERALCTSASLRSESAAALDFCLQANEAAHLALGVLRGDECMAGFGNLGEEALADRVTVGDRGQKNHHRSKHAREDSHFPEDVDEYQFHGWSPVSVTVEKSQDESGSISSSGVRKDGDSDALQQDQPLEGPTSSHHHNRRRSDGSKAASGIVSNSDISFTQQKPSGGGSTLGLGALGLQMPGSSIDIADPSLVADVADIPAAMSQNTSPTENTAGALSPMLGPASRFQSQQTKTPAMASAESGAATSNGRAAEPSIGAIDHVEAPGAIRRRSSALSRRSHASDYTSGDFGSSNGSGGSGSRERATLHKFVVQLSRLFGRHYPGCAQEWADVAIKWAMSCPVRSLAGLALQIFSVLAAEAQHGGSVVITPTRQMILRLVDRLCNVVGDPSPEFSAFSDIVLAGLRQSAGLAARMCADDENVKADLLAVSMSLMLTAQSANVYSVSLSIFERIFPLIASEEQRFRELIVERGGSLCASGYQAAMLRGLEYVACRDRCLRLLRETFSYDWAAADSGVYQTHDSHPILALAAHLPMLVDDSMQSALGLQCEYLAKLPTHKEQQAKPDNGADAGEKNSGALLGASTNAGRAIHKHNYRRPRAPSFSATAFGSSLGLMLGGAGFGSPPINSNSHSHGGGQNQQSSHEAPSSSSLAAAILQPSSVLGTPSRLQLFRRRGHNQQQQQKAQRQTQQNSNSTAADDGDKNVDDANDIDAESSNGGGSSEAHLNEEASSANAGTPSVAFVDARAPLHEKYMDFVTYCSQLALLRRNDISAMANEDGSYNPANHFGIASEQKEISQLFQRLACLLSPPASSLSLQYAANMSREVIEQFGYAAIECGPRVAVEIVAILLRFLNCSGRARAALKYLRDDQVQRALDTEDQQQLAISSGYIVELRRIDICLRLLQAVLTAASGDGGSGGAIGGGLGGAGGLRQSQHPQQLRLDLATMTPQGLRYLFDLVIAPRPISDLASRVLHVLLQRFDDSAGPVGVNGGGGGGSAAAGGLNVSCWYESDQMTLVSSVRGALSRVVSLGIGRANMEAEMAEARMRRANNTTDDSDDEDDSGGICYDGYRVDGGPIIGNDGVYSMGPLPSVDVAMYTSRSTSPEMPVLVIPDHSEDSNYPSATDGSLAAAEDNDNSGGGDDGSNSDTDDILAQLDELDKELDEALLFG